MLFRTDKLKITSTYYDDPGGAEYKDEGSQYHVNRNFRFLADYHTHTHTQRERERHTQRHTQRHTHIQSYIAIRLSHEWVSRNAAQNPDPSNALLARDFAISWQQQIDAGT